ncbi:protein IQ-DOMAIN 19 [Hevea brasiliensis]|uniref:protein IQ-DOMAIN 19 n=1 Tax=Hevea brasiliensis TaxID=3981 RepID=UPI0025F716D9|nr:protein IQ-DOMAIN 19 [Hevea brasiliensis]
MGKASKWIINFLLGKKEEKEKKKNIAFYDGIGSTVATPTSSVPSTPYKRRWSFGKSASKERVHKCSKSLDSITPLIAQHASLLEWENQQSNKKVKALAAPTETIKRVVAPRHVAADRISKSVEDAAATRIQAAFRSYLARKALCALRALVKLQALVRGHLVRKQTTATLRQMHALMAIQVRARFQRIQMAEESSQLVVRSQSSRRGSSSHDNGLRGAYKEAIDLDIYETKRILKNKHEHLNHSQMERREHGRTKYYSEELSILKQEHQYEEFSFSTAQNSPQICSPIPNTIPGRASFTYQKPDYVHSISHPNYMANTESSRAKVRSQSEPKQRPKWGMRPKSNQMASMDGKNAQQEAHIQGSSFHLMPIAYENQDPWFIKLYQSTMSKDIDCDPKSTSSSSYPNHSKLLVEYEVGFALNFFSISESCKRCFSNSSESFDSSPI